MPEPTEQQLREALEHTLSLTQPLRAHLTHLAEAFEAEAQAKQAQAQACRDLLAKLDKTPLFKAGTPCP